ncbi:CHAT domain-containing protein [Xylaria grammica]|nr:CHAT domain-containing protein [Xylaria grammica]
MPGYAVTARDLNNLELFLGSRYKRIGEISDLQEAIDTARQAVDSMPANHPNQATCLNNLGIKLLRRYEQTGDIVNLNYSITSFHTAWRSITAIPFHRIRAGARCLTLLASHHQLNAAVNLGMDILDFLPYINTRLLGRLDQQFVMSTVAGVATDLCSVLLLLGQPADALRQLERGRAVIISQLLDTRSDLSVVEQQRPDMCRRFQHLRDEVGRPRQQVEEGVIRRQIQVRQIRCLTGHEQFMRGQQISEMQDCAAEGTIVVVNSTTIHSGAIIVSPRAIKVIELTQLALWEVYVKPIIDEVCPVANGASVLPRIRWIGSGLASSMPFHAAGVHSGGSRENALHRTISSYSPPIKALSHARRRVATLYGAKGPLLITTMPTTPGDIPGDRMSDLPGVEEERIRLMHAASGCLSVTHLEPPSVEDLIKALPQYPIAHFACHGVTNYLDPSQSGLVLRKGTSQDRLTVQKVSELALPNAKIAYLSACSTAQNEAAQLSDEVIHVVSGFQVAGFPHVIGCLWPSNDRVCVQVADRFYQSLLEDRTGLPEDERVAWALHKAVTEARDADPRMPLY